MHTALGQPGLCPLLAKSRTPTLDVAINSLRLHSEPAGRSKPGKKTDLLRCQTSPANGRHVQTNLATYAMAQPASWRGGSLVRRLSPSDPNMINKHPRS